MKKLLILGSLLIIMLVAVAGCGAENSEEVAESSQGENSYQSDVLTMDYEGALSPTLQLTLGIMMLEESEYPIPMEQAEELLPLWKALRGLQESGTASPEEFNAVLKQIEGELTSEQLQFIVNMKIDRTIMTEWIENSGMEVAQRPDGAQPPEGGGGPGQGGRGQDGGGDFTPEEIATFQAERGGSQGGSGGASQFYDVVVEMLEEITRG